MVELLLSKQRLRRSQLVYIDCKRKLDRQACLVHKRIRDVVFRRAKCIGSTIM